MTTETPPLARATDLLTHTSMSTFAQCRRKYQLRYILGLVPDREPGYFRFGGAYHLAHEVLGKTGSLERAVEAVRERYNDLPPWARNNTEAQAELAVECETVVRLFCGWHWRWASDEYLSANPEERVDVLQAEESFALPILNPETGGTAKAHRRAGKRDQLISYQSRTLLREFKTTGDDIAPESDYWRHLRIDAQISNYFLSYETEGVQLDGVLYDVVRKPSIRPKQIPTLDGDGKKIVVDKQTGERLKNKDGKSWKQSVSDSSTQELLSRTETPSEYGDRLTQDIGERPDWYFARREAPRLASDIEEFKADLWMKHVAIMHAKRMGHFPRESRSCFAMGKCPYFDLCANNWIPEGSDMPEGFVLTDDYHPELD